MSLVSPESEFYPKNKWRYWRFVRRVGALAFPATIFIAWVDFNENMEYTATKGERIIKGASRDPQLYEELHRIANLGERAKRIDENPDAFWKGVPSPDDGLDNRFKKYF